MLIHADGPPNTNVISEGVAHALSSCIGSLPSGPLKPKASASSIIKNCEIYVPLEGIIDLDVERERLSKEISRFKGALIGVNKKLSNEKFANNAPPEVIEKEKAKKSDWESSIEKLNQLLEDLT